MRILALQLKRIGDLVLTAPALRALRAADPDAHIALAVSDGCAALLPAIPGVDTTLVFGRGRGFAPWQQVIAGSWDVCLDFTGTDRSAFATALSRAGQRVTFSWVRRNKIRALAYSQFVDSDVRERHTADHYLDLVAAVAAIGVEPALPSLVIPPDAAQRAAELLAGQGVNGQFALLHPGTARVEKYWRPDRWAQVIEALHRDNGLRSVISCGPDAFERSHTEEIEAMNEVPSLKVLHPHDLLVLTALAARARVVVSCDTAMVHLAAAFRTPQVALFGPTNPFHWRPRHDRTVVISAAQPDAPLTEFQPRMRGAPMERISTETVIRATNSILAEPLSSFSSSSF